MPNQPVTPADINQRNQQFWSEQSGLLSSRIQDEPLYKIAMQDISEQTSMRVPPRWLKSLEQALAHADHSRTILTHAFARKGGKAAKADALQRLIIEIARAEPNINTRQLLGKIRTMAKGGNSIISRVGPKPDAPDDQNQQIHFENSGESKSAPVSGLKDRLSRAKREILSR